MKHILLPITLFIICTAPIFGQTELRISDTRYVNDPPNFISHKFRLDFKERNIIGVPGNGGYSTTMTISPWLDNTGGFVHQLNFNDGGIYYRTGVFNSASWNAWRRVVVEDETGNVGIGTTNPTSKLTVAGNISAREINVAANAGADFVFAPDYRLRPLNEVETFINANRHLPDIAPANDMMQNGVNMGEMQIRLLQKIEELTLYIIEQEKRMDEFKKENEKQQKEIETLKQKNTNR